MKYSVSPVVRVAVDVKCATDLPKLVDGLRKLAKSDPLVVCSTEESGQHIVAGCGELHVEICLKDLEETFARCPIKTSEPVVQYKETVTEQSTQNCLSKSANKLNRLFCIAKPLDDQLTTAIEDELIQSKMDHNELARKLVNEYEWESSEAKKVWCFGPETSGANLLVDTTRQVQYLNEIRDTMEAAF